MFRALLPHPQEALHKRHILRAYNVSHIKIFQIISFDFWLKRGMPKEIHYTVTLNFQEIYAI
jgi:hypothetical protein